MGPTPAFWKKSQFWWSHVQFSGPIANGFSGLATNRHLDRLSTPAGIADPVFGVVFVDKILHDAAAFEYVYLVSVRVGVSQGGNAAVGVYGGEPWRLLFVGRHVYLVSFVGETKLGEGDADFDAVWGLGSVEGYVWGWSGGRHCLFFFVVAFSTRSGEYRVRRRLQAVCRRLHVLIYSLWYRAGREGTVLDARNLGFAPLPIDFDLTSLLRPTKVYLSAPNSNKYTFTCVQIRLVAT